MSNYLATVVSRLDRQFLKAAQAFDGKGRLDDAVAAFAWAVIGLAKHGEDFPQLKRPMKAEEVAWRTVGEILFWMHKVHLSDQERRSHCAPLWRRLIDGFATATVEPLMLLEQFSSEQALMRVEGLQTVRDAFREEVRDLLERALENLENVSSLFEAGKWPYFSEKRQNEVIHTLGEVGNRETIIKLRVFADHPKLGVTAVEAIRKLGRETS